jgi:uncharacterized membrane protein YhdT
MYSFISEILEEEGIGLFFALYFIAVFILFHLLPREAPERTPRFVWFSMYIHPEIFIFITIGYALILIYSF